ncbi:MAG: transposase [Ignavibacteriales bacterium]|nr:transposase [Ignavibacteriales bacterium]MCF8316172.1 transposase [Ignavibacteriales bacterium]MCF8436674.1 transposase [Ignavibacteriales bacterium]
MNDVTTGQVPRLESLHSPQLDLDNLKLKSYGVGVDCHSKFYQVNLRIKGEDEAFYTYDYRVNANIPEMLGIKQELLGLIERYDETVNENNFHYTCESSGPYHKPLINAWKGIPSVVNPLLAGHTRRKTDVLDSKLLSFHDITGIWESTYVMPGEYEVLRQLIRISRNYQSLALKAKQKIVTVTTMFGNTISQLDSVNKSLIRGVLEDFSNYNIVDHPYMINTEIPKPLGELILQFYKDYDYFTMQEKYHWNMMKDYVAKTSFLIPKTGEMISGTELYTLLKTVPGFGETSIYIMLTEVADISRFSSAKKFVAYCGFDPSLKVSADKVVKHVRRRGNSLISHVLRKAVGSLIIRKSEPFGKWAYVLMKKNKKGGFRKACSALARRSLIGAYYVWYNGVEFSYKNYRLNMYENIKIESIDYAPLNNRLKGILKNNNFTDSEHILRKIDEVFALPGIGEKAQEEIGKWLNSLRENASEEQDHG